MSRYCDKAGESALPVKVVGKIVCVICNRVDKLCILSELLSEKGAISLISAILTRGDSIPITSEGQYDHGNCRKNYSNKRKILQAIQNNDTFQQRNYFSVNHEKQGVSDFPSRFDFDKNCFLCGDSAERADEWSAAVSSRIETGFDLENVTLVHHTNCFTNFHTLRQIPVKRKVEDDDSERYKAFLVAATHISQ
ncbi:hypothetical protein OUZ56_005487 [Daphnia magna]|uniref:Cc8L18.2-like protein n=1 Tax=Daphnia magna TaxID=35525 RepID=A0ABQ9YSX4_9CRUS|nr:hypothetical protein OUZ56_005487 [Daphnia magna]